MTLECGFIKWCLIILSKIKIIAAGTDSRDTPTTANQNKLKSYYLQVSHSEDPRAKSTTVFLLIVCSIKNKPSFHLGWPPDPAKCFSAISAIHRTPNAVLPYYSNYFLITEVVRLILKWCIWSKHSDLFASFFCKMNCSRV